MGVDIIMAINIGVIDIGVIDVIMKKTIAEFPKEQSNSDITIKGTYPHQPPSSWNCYQRLPNLFPHPH